VLSCSEWATVARAADFGHRDYSEYSASQRRRRVAKSFVEHDRQLRARESGYATRTTVMWPRSATPKNDVIVGWPQCWEEVAPFFPDYLAATAAAADADHATDATATATAAAAAAAAATSAAAATAPRLRNEDSIDTSDGSETTSAACLVAGTAALTAVAQPSSSSSCGGGGAAAKFCVAPPPSVTPRLALALGPLEAHLFGSGGLFERTERDAAENDSCEGSGVEDDDEGSDS